MDRGTADASDDRAAETPRESTSSCPAPASDEACTDELKHGRQLADPAMLDGSILDVGSAIAGVMPVELPPTGRRARGEADGRGGDRGGGSGGCGSCDL